MELTAQTITQEVVHLAKNGDVFICGGGAHNHALLSRIQALLGLRFDVKTTDEKGIASDWMEAMLFAWLAKMRMERQPLDLSNITGAHESAILGCIFRGCE